MKAKDLKPGDRFTVDPPDPESPTRVCLTNDQVHGIRFGWPRTKRYWCNMGEEVEVTLIEPAPVPPTNDEMLPEFLKIARSMGWSEEEKCSPWLFLRNYIAELEDKAGKGSTEGLSDSEVLLFYTETARAAGWSEEVNCTPWDFLSDYVAKRNLWENEIELPEGRPVRFRIIRDLVDRLYSSWQDGDRERVRKTIMALPKGMAIAVTAQLTSTAIGFSQYCLEKEMDAGTSKETT